MVTSTQAPVPTIKTSNNSSTCRDSRFERVGYRGCAHCTDRLRELGATGRVLGVLEQLADHQDLARALDSGVGALGVDGVRGGDIAVAANEWRVVGRWRVTRFAAYY